MPHRPRPSVPRRVSGRRGPVSRNSGVSRPHEVLGLSKGEVDAVRVIEVAHLLLRRWRMVRSGVEVPGPAPASPAEVTNRIRQIVAAREAMLQRIHAASRSA